MGAPIANEVNASRSASSASHYVTVVAVFCGLLLISNVAAVKPIEIGSLIFDGGAILFPLTYVLGDVLAEVYGFRRAKRAIWIGFFLGAVASLCFFAVDSLPAPDWAAENAEAFSMALGFVPAIVLASLCGYLAGQLLNARVLVSMKRRSGENALWSRLLGSTLVGEFADTLIFCMIATAIGPFIWADFWNYFLVGYIFKCAVEVIMLPITYRVIAFMKAREPSYSSASA
ncbi:queuosine precursor transporter [Cumulibacter soli]|uniref:queuosine precursor transporter n=1 Tax=Cumulibacter soli TaxID=2546344 RepID=UPI0010684B29|nr:queuosine precursor transporter [Cumulibacter soli]